MPLSVEHVRASSTDSCPAGTSHDTPPLEVDAEHEARGEGRDAHGDQQRRDAEPATAAAPEVDRRLG
jgi:hypothetical protein